jgi:hypothetical protein
MNTKHIKERLAGCHLGQCDSRIGGLCDCGAEKLIANVPADRRVTVGQHDPERRSGWDRRAKVAPAKDDVGGIEQ